MKRPATWKAVTVGAALTGLAITGAATATAQLPPEQVRETAVGTSDDESRVALLTSGSDDEQLLDESRLLHRLLGR